MPFASLSIIALAVAAPQAGGADNYQAADAALNAQYRRTMTQAQTRDRGGRPADGGPTYAAALLAAQRAWIQFRDAECRIESYQYRGGSAQRMVHRQCLTTLTRQRTAQLRTLQQSLTPL
jgi:uncharacterized protein YecT (DUF1311 family)